MKSQINRYTMTAVCVEDNMSCEMIVTASNVIEAFNIAKEAFASTKKFFKYPVLKKIERLQFNDCRSM